MKKKYLKNIVGIILGIGIAIGLPCFSIWQYDIICSGPIWHVNPGNTGWMWHGPGAYSEHYFQCWLWKTTVGQAYDTLLFLMFIGIIIGITTLFLSLWYWESNNA